MELSLSSDSLADLFASLGVGGHAKQAGDAAPHATALDRRGLPVRLRDHWLRAPLIVVFFRGGWCSYCNLQLHAWQRECATLRRLGATLLAISPQAPQDGEMGFQVLSDPSLAVAEAFGIAFTLPPELVEYFAEIGTDIPVLNGNGLWALPVPATFVIDTHGTVRYADVQPDYRRRPDPAEVLAVVRGIVG